MDVDVEKEEKRAEKKAAAAEFFLQWGNKKRLRCVRVRGSPTDVSDQSNVTARTTTSRIRRKTFLSSKEPLFPHPSRLTRNADTMPHRSENGKTTSPSPDRHYTTRGSIVGLDEFGKITTVVEGGAGNHHLGKENNCNNSDNNSLNGINNNNGNNSRRLVWPKIYVTLSSKEKEEDFMAMKGCKLPQRPKKRPKVVQRTLLMVTPGAWLTEVCRERYEVKEKKNSKKQKPRGLKAMGGVESDSE